MLKKSKKFILVDPAKMPEIISNNNNNNRDRDLQTQQQQSSSGLLESKSTVIDAHDHADAAIPEDVRAKVYYQLLNRLMAAKHQQSQRQMQGADGVTEASFVTDEQILDSIPLQDRYKANRILNLIKTNPEGGWNGRGQFIYRQTVVPHSNIIDLISEVASSKKNPKFPVTPGWTTFADYLKEIGVTKDLVTNRHYWSHISGQIPKTRAKFPVKKSPTEKSPTGVVTRRGGAKKRKLNLQTPISASKWEEV